MSTPLQPITAWAVCFMEAQKYTDEEWESWMNGGWETGWETDTKPTHGERDADPVPVDEIPKRARRNWTQHVQWNAATSQKTTTPTEQMETEAGGARKRKRDVRDSQ